MATTVQSLLDRFDALMNDVGAVRWPTAERLMWVNDGQRELVTFKDDANTKTAILQTSVGARQALPNTTDCYKIVGVRAGHTNRAVLPCDRAALDAFKPDWMADSNDDPVKNWMPDESPMAIWVYPSRLTGGDQMMITYVAYPPTVTEGADSIGVRDAYSTNVLHYMIYRAYSKDAETAGNAELAAAAYQLFRG